MTPGVPPKVLVLTDSLGFPRATPEHVDYEQSYVALLKRAHPGCDVIHLGIGGGTIADLFKFSSYYREALRPELVLIQSGIVDCAPRALRLVEQQVVSRLGAPGRWLQRIIARNSVALRRTRRIAYTPPARFAHFVGEFERAFPVLHWIGILPAQPAYEEKLPGISAAIAAYNAILRDRVASGFVSIDDFGADEAMSDFHHLSVTGHRRVFERLSPIVARVAPRAA